MASVTRRTLRVYAALTELRGQGDVIDALIPFFEPVLSVMDGKIFEPSVFAAGIRKLYRWRFTTDIAFQFIPRLSARGYLERIQKGRTDVIYVVRHKEANGDESQAPISNIVESIIDEFEKFPPRVTDLLSYTKSRDQLKDILIRFLVSMDAYGQGAYAPQLGSLQPVGEAREILEALEEGGEPLEPNDRYMCAKFVQYLLKKRREFVPHLSRLASIALLTEVVEDFLKPTHAAERADLTIVLDAPLALDLLGCSGLALRDDIKQVVDALSAIGCKFIVFPASCLEMQQNLRSMLSLPPANRRGYTHNAMVKREVETDYVIAVANNPERALRDIGIAVRQIELQNFPSTHKFFTQDQYEDFFSSIMWVDDVKPREHDATCATLIMRLREGRQDRDIFSTRFVLATRNGRFVTHSRSYCLDSRLINAQQVGPAIHQRELATAAWLRTGLGADDTIPRGRLIATCDRVLSVRPEVRKALAAQIAKLTPERLEQLNLLMLDSRSVQKLADQTLNNENIITADNAERLLEAIRKATAEEEREAFEAKLAEERAEADTREYEIVQALAEAEAVLQEERTERIKRDGLVQAQIQRVVQDVNRTARRIESTFTVALMLSTACLVVLTYYFTISEEWYVRVPLFCAFLFSVYRAISAAIERPTKGLATILNYFNTWLLWKRLRHLGLEEEPMARNYSSVKGRLVSGEV